MILFWCKYLVIFYIFKKIFIELFFRIIFNEVGAEKKYSFLKKIILINCCSKSLINYSVLFNANVPCMCMFFYLNKNVLFFITLPNIVLAIIMVGFYDHFLISFKFMQIFKLNIHHLQSLLLIKFKF